MSMKFDWVWNSRSLSRKSAFHVAALAHHASVVVGLARVQLGDIEDEYVLSMVKYRCCTLTGWMFTFQGVFLVLALAVDTLEWNGRSVPGLLRARDMVYCALVFPFTMAICMVFWLFYWYDRELIYPAVWDDVIPSWANHGLHSVTPLVAVLELMLQPRGRTKERTTQIAVHWLFSIGYAVMFYGVYMMDRVWLYPLMGRMSWFQMCTFQTIFCLSGQVFYELQELITSHLYQCRTVEIKS